MADKIVVLDFGSQYNQLIARRIREFGVYSELHPHTMTLEEIKALGDVKGIVFSGGPNSVYNEAAPKCDPAIYESGIPILGICYGMQMVQHDMGGKVLPSDKKNMDALKSRSIQNVQFLQAFLKLRRYGCPTVIRLENLEKVLRKLPVRIILHLRLRQIQKKYLYSTVSS